MCIKWPWSTAHCIKWEPHMEPCKHVSAWEDCCDYRGRVLISPRKLSCQGWSYSMAINCWPWGPGCMHFFWLYNLSEAFGPECLRRVLHVLFHQSATTPYCLRAALGFLVFPLRSWTLSKISLWPLLESSPPLGLVAWQTEGLLFTFLFCTGTGWGGAHSWITQALLKNSQSGQRSDMNINDQNTLFLSVYKGSSEKGSDWNTCFWPACLCVLFMEWWKGGPRRGQSNLRPWSHLSSIRETTWESCCGSLGELLHLHFLEPQFL